MRLCCMIAISASKCVAMICLCFEGSVYTWMILYALMLRLSVGVTDVLIHRHGMLMAITDALYAIKLNFRSNFTWLFIAEGNFFSCFAMNNRKNHLLYYGVFRPAISWTIVDDCDFYVLKNRNYSKWVLYPFVWLWLRFLFALQERITIVHASPIANSWTNHRRK